MVGGKQYCVCCSNFLGKIVNGRKVSLHRIPANKQLSKVWIQRLKLVRKDFPTVIKSSTRVCSEHFKFKKGPQPHDQIPTIFQNKTLATSMLSQVPKVSTCTYQASSDVQAKNLSFKTSSEASGQSVSVQLHDYCGYVNPESFDKVHVTEMCQTSTSTVEIQTQTPHVLMADAQTQTDNSLKAAAIIDNDGLVISETVLGAIENVLPHCDVRKACIHHTQSHYPEIGPTRLSITSMMPDTRQISC
ncbi:hypothetical protein ElyMa_006401900 [Elysia marginata]|uniref:THAP-type domain-containing protein n=1 Tax=Elysia marginata TaxID=1093978 RepID=A0AAV4HRQ0_9GAST|nr:hypothetical protein ElyMa_006401900 [Elysia marginata]